LGLAALFPYQRLVVAGILRSVDKPDAEDARPREIVVLPTGAGKSLCFQVPAVALPGITVVAFPLLALISDQKRRMDHLGIPAAVITGATGQAERRRILEKLRDGRLRVLLSNPETLRGPSMLRALEGLRISHFVVDEAHCVIEWGERFRPAYLELHRIIEAAGPVRVSAFTATASPELRSRIATRLFGDRSWSSVAGSPDRPNIHYAVMRPIHGDHALTWLLRRPGPDPWPSFPPVPRPAIVFCPTRDESERSARLLRLRLRDHAVRFYHAGLDRDEKTEIENWFFHSRNGVLCSTSAYGMGVDKADIRAVVHRRAPESVESYLQESGRAGRDGRPARAILLAPETAPNERPDSGPARAPAPDHGMTGYVETDSCRRRYLLQAMGADGECSGCDRCDGAADPSEAERRIVVSVLRRPFPRDVDLLPERITLRGWDRGLRLPPWHRRDVAAVARAYRRRRRAQTLPIRRGRSDASDVRPPRRSR
jgi:ATP-dependent DNA helicase RecQ